MSAFPSTARADDFWDVVDECKFAQFYTSPTAIRAIMREGETPILKRDLSSLKLLGSVGVPLNPEVWLWHGKDVGKDHCPVVDIWWQTETGGILTTPVPGAHSSRPAGRAGRSSVWSR